MHYINHIFNFIDSIQIAIKVYIKLSREKTLLYFKSYYPLWGTRHGVHSPSTHSVKYGVYWLKTSQMSGLYLVIESPNIDPILYKLIWQFYRKIGARDICKNCVEIRELIERTWDDIYYRTDFIALKYWLYDQHGMFIRMLWEMDEIGMGKLKTRKTCKDLFSSQESAFLIFFLFLHTCMMLPLGRKQDNRGC